MPAETQKYLSTRRTRLAILLAIAAMVIIIGTAVIEYRDYTGYCFADRRFLSDSELIDVAITQELRMNESSNYVRDRKTYPALRDFHAENPNCCTVFRRGHPLMQEGGSDVIGVEVDYQLRNGGSERYRHSFSFITACGFVLRRSSHDDSMSYR
jgi:hypothetical protein